MSFEDVLQTMDKINAHCRKEIEDIIVGNRRKTISSLHKEMKKRLPYIARELNENPYVVEQVYFAWVHSTRMLLEDQFRGDFSELMREQGFKPLLQKVVDNDPVV